MTAIRFARAARAGLLAVGIASSAAPLAAQDVSPQPPRPETTARDVNDGSQNVRFEITVTYTSKAGGDSTRSAVLTVKSGASGSFRSGNQVPVPSTTFTPIAKAEGGGAVPAPFTSFSYKAIGLDVDVERVSIGSGGRVTATVKVDTTGVDTKSYPQPSFPTFRQTFGLVLDSGKPLEVVRSRDLVNGVVTEQAIEVKATILK